MPILGVCLGHQAIGAAYGGAVVRAPMVMHGKLSAIHHSDQGVFASLPQAFQATRYHSLIVRRDDLPDCLEVTAWTEDGLIMGMRHRDLPVEGVQFHPESIMTEVGKDLLRNFLQHDESAKLIATRRAARPLPREHGAGRRVARRRRGHASQATVERRRTSESA